jgi:hypothetical protein
MACVPAKLGWCMWQVGWQRQRQAGWQWSGEGMEASGCSHAGSVMYAAEQTGIEREADSGTQPGKQAMAGRQRQSFLDSCEVLSWSAN